MVSATRGSTATIGPATLSYQEGRSGFPFFAGGRPRTLTTRSIAVEILPLPRDGRPAVAQIERLRSEYPMDPEGPDADLLITWNRGIDALEHPELGTVGPFPHRRTGRHTSHGFAYFAGPGIEPCDLGDRNALDLTATILALLGREPPKRLAGRPIPI